MHTNELMIYRNLDYGKILQDMTFLIEHEGVVITIRKI